jgi:hypothetical protein
VKPTSLRPKGVAFALLVAFVCPVFAQQPPQTDTRTKTRVCAIEDVTYVTSPDNPATSQDLRPGYCIDCWAGLGCGEPFLAAGLLGLIGGSAGGTAAAAAAAAAVAGGVLGGLSATGNLGGGDGNGNPSPPGPPPGPPGPPGPTPALTPVFPPPTPLPTSPPVSPSQ